MVTTKQIRDGVRAYVDEQILPNLTGVQRFGAAVYVELASQSFDKWLRDMLSKPSVGVLNLVDDNGGVDIDKLYKAAAAQIKAVQKLDVQIPVVGHILFSVNDLDKLNNWIRRA